MKRRFFLLGTIALIISCLPFQTDHVLALEMNELNEDFDQHTYRSYGLNYRVAQVTLFPPLGSNGIESSIYGSRYSLNIIGGYNGGLHRGYEIGLLNINKYYVDARFQAGLLNVTGGPHSGFSLAGLGGVSSGSMQGVYIAGLAHVSQRHMRGIHVAGGINLAGKEMSGVQVAGLMQFSGDEMKGIQVAGLMNITTYGLYGISVSGLANIGKKQIAGIQVAGTLNAGESVQGLAASGFMNVGKKEMEGLIIASAVNFSGGHTGGLFVSGLANASLGDSYGLFIAGLANFSGGDASGLMISGVVHTSKSFDGLSLTGALNIQREDVRGIQISGLGNISRTAYGLQIAPVNVAEYFEGVSIGLISLYGNGRKQLDVFADETGFIYTSLKTGTSTIYNSLGIGYKPWISDRDVFALSWSIGFVRPLSEVWDRKSLEKYHFVQDFKVSLIQDDGWFKNDMSRLYSYRRLFGVDVFDGMMAYAGPTFNILVGRSEHIDDHHTYHFFDTSRNGRSYRFWVGGSIGIQLF